jgi:hypothetical protein
MTNCSHIFIMQKSTVLLVIVQCVIFQYRREVFDFINIHIRSCEFSIMTEMNKILRGRKDEKQSFFVIKLNVKMVWLINTVDYS